MILSLDKKWSKIFFLSCPRHWDREFVTYRPRPSSQNRKCTGASGRGISGYNLDCGRVELSAKLWRLQEEEWVTNYYITRCTGSSISWREDAGMRNMSQRGCAPRPPVEQPRRTGKKRCYEHKSGGQYVAVLFRLQLTSHTVKPLVTLSNPFK